MQRNTCTLLLPKQKKERIVKPSIPAAYGNWLNSIHWDFYCTFTTRYPMGVDSARRTMDRLQSILERKYNEKPTIFWAAEPFDTKYGCHVHALIEIKSKTPQTIKHIKDAWQIASNCKRLREYNNTTIKPYDPLLGGHFYVSKYIHRFNADYNIL
jgi:hypothetical protein